MANFYDTWLGFWEEGNATKAAARAVIHEEDLEWGRDGPRLPHGVDGGSRERLRDMGF